MTTDQRWKRAGLAVAAVAGIALLGGCNVSCYIVRDGDATKRIIAINGQEADSARAACQQMVDGMNEQGVPARLIGVSLW